LPIPCLSFSFSLVTRSDCPICFASCASLSQVSSFRLFLVFSLQFTFQMVASGLTRSHVMRNRADLVCPLTCLFFYNPNSQSPGNQPPLSVFLTSLFLSPVESPYGRLKLSSAPRAPLPLFRYSPKRPPNSHPLSKFPRLIEISLFFPPLCSLPFPFASLRALTLLDVP